MRTSLLVAGGVALLGLSALAAPARAGDDDPILVTVTATSTLAPIKKNSYEPWRPLVGDGFWCEGKPDEGVGEALVLDFAEPVRVATVFVTAGVTKSPALFKANNLPTAIDVVTDDGRKVTATTSDAGRGEATLGGAPVKQLKLQIAKVKKGRMNDSCISSVDLDVDRRPVLIGVDRTQLAALTAKLPQLWQALDGCDPAAARQHFRFPLPVETTGDGETMKTKKLKDAASFVKACKGLDLPSYRDMKVADARLKSEGPGRVEVRDDVLAWHLALDGGAWKLVGLRDDTP